MEDEGRWGGGRKGETGCREITSEDGKRYEEEAKLGKRVGKSGGRQRDWNG